MLQVGFIFLVSACALWAMPLFYAHRMDSTVLTLGIGAFVGLPVLAGVVLQAPHRLILPIAAVLLILCPVVFSVTDPLAAEFEKPRDAYFLATGSTIAFVSAIWLASSFKSRRWAVAASAAMGLLGSAVGIFVLLGIVMFLE